MRRAHKVRAYLTKKWNRIVSAIMLSFVLVLNFVAFTFIGCGEKNHVIDSPIYHRRPAMKQIIIEKPPARVVYTGVVTDQSSKFVNECLVEMTKIPYRNYRFNTNFYFELKTSSGSEELLEHDASFSSSRKVKR
jgi:hypothetical protein